MRRRLWVTCGTWSPYPHGWLHSRALLPAHPLSDVGRAMEQLDALRFAGDEKPHHDPVHQRHLVQVEYEPRALAPDLSLEFVQVLRLDTTDQPQRRGLAVGRRFDPQGHLRESTAMHRGREASTAPWLSAAGVKGWLQAGGRRISNCRTVGAFGVADVGYDGLDDGFVNMGLPATVFSVATSSCRTSQCSTIRSPSNRKMSAAISVLPPPE